MRLDLQLDEKMKKDALGNETRKSFGHLGTHIDLKGKTFEDQELKAIIVRLKDGEELTDADLSAVEEGVFVIFASGHSMEYRYGSEEYRHGYATLGQELIERLIAKKVSLIGTDAPGIRQGPEHPLMDSYLAGRGIFVIENMQIPEELEEGTVYRVSVKARGKADDGMPVEIILDE